MHRRKHAHGHEIIAGTAVVLAIVLIAAVALVWLGRSLGTAVL